MTCTRYLKNLCGLMFSRKLKDKGLIFVFERERIVSLHMYGVFFPIDVVYLNSDKEVVEIKKSLKPFWFYTPKNKAKYVIELPKGSLKKTGINDKIGF